MDELGLFTAALGLSGPWRVVRTEFDVEGTRLDLYLDFERGARFACPASVWVPNRSSTSCGLGIFMDQPTESVAASKVQVGR